MQPSSVALVLHANQPYLRTSGRSFHGEEPLHELIATTVIPTLNVLYDLYEQRSTVRVGLAYSPLLLEQLGDTVVLKHVQFWIDAWIAQLAASTTNPHTSAEEAYQGNFFLEVASGIRQSFEQRFGRNLIGALRHLVDEGVIEPLASAATYPRLSAISQPAILRAQIELGLLAVTRAFGKRPTGFWLPTNSYHADATNILLDSGITAVIIQSDQAQPAWIVPNRLAALPSSSQFDPYLAVEGLSYSGDPFYLVPQTNLLAMRWQRRGLRQREEAYDPYDAYRKAQEHAEHFCAVLAASTEAAPSLQIVTLDAAVIGMHWFEGPAWLRALLILLADHEQLALTTPAAYLSANRPRQTWQSPALPAQAHAADYLLHATEGHFTQLARRHANAEGELERVLCQAARELLLAQAHGESDAAAQRTTRHRMRCEQLCALAANAALSDADLTLLETLEEEDNPFTDLNFRVVAG